MNTKLECDPGLVWLLRSLPKDICADSQYSDKATYRVMIYEDIEAEDEESTTRPVEDALVRIRSLGVKCLRIDEPTGAVLEIDRPALLRQLNLPEHFSDHPSAECNLPVQDFNGHLCEHFVDLIYGRRLEGRGANDHEFVLLCERFNERRPWQLWLSSSGETMLMRSLGDLIAHFNLDVAIVRQMIERFGGKAGARLLSEQLP